MRGAGGVTQRVCVFKPQHRRPFLLVLVLAFQTVQTINHPPLTRSGNLKEKYTQDILVKEKTCHRVESLLRKPQGPQTIFLGKSTCQVIYSSKSLSFSSFQVHVKYFCPEPTRQLLGKISTCFYLQYQGKFIGHINKIG